jgi:hypothetical protein
MGVPAVWLPMLGSELEASIKRDGRKPFQKSRFLRLMLWKSSPDTPLMTEAAALTWFLLSQFISVMVASDLPIRFCKPKSPGQALDIWTRRIELADKRGSDAHDGPLARSRLSPQKENALHGCVTANQIAHHLADQCDHSGARNDLAVIVLAAVTSSRNPSQRFGSGAFSS